MSKMLQKFQELLKVGDGGWALIDLLDEVNSIEEFEELAPVMKDSIVGHLVDFYRKNLVRWKDPQLPADFQEKCPLLAARMDTPQKIRILLRGAAFRKVEPLLMGEVLEDIIRRHEMNGEMKVICPEERNSSQWHAALRMVYHTQLQARTLVKLALPGHKVVGYSSTEGVFVVWRTEEDRKASGED